MRLPFGRRPPRLAPAEAYRRWASTYGAEPNALQQLEQRAMEELFPEVRHRTLLDAGCGTGRLARLALERGARSVLGLDATLGMLLATGRREGERIGWLQGSVTALPLPGACCDVVLCALVLGHVPALDQAIGELGRVLRPGGVLLLSDFHPFATLRGCERTFRDRDAGTGGRTYAIDQHLHLFADYVRFLRQAGLVLDALREPLFEEHPVVFVLRAIKGTAARREGAPAAV